MQDLKKMVRVGVAVIAATAWMGASNAATIVKNLTPTSEIPGLSDFTTTGAEMAGMSVTATFAGAGSETLFWAATGPSSGGVSGTGWSLSQSGNTFGGLWTFSMSSDLGVLTSLVLSGNPAFTVFDTSEPSFGTDGSFNGLDFTINSSSTLNGNATATYTDAVYLTGDPVVGDLFHVLTITFADGTAPRTGFTFIQDTDNDIRRFAAPEPGALALLGLALAAAGFARARRKSV